MIRPVYFEYHKPEIFDGERNLALGGVGECSLAFDALGKVQPYSILNIFSKFSPLYSAARIDIYNMWDDYMMTYLLNKTERKL